MAWIIHRDKKDNDSLMHYGVKGQKWGKRQYQNEDGTLTPEGKRRYKEMLRKRAESFQSEKAIQDIDPGSGELGYEGMSKRGKSLTGVTRNGLNTLVLDRNLQLQKIVESLPGFKLGDINEDDSITYEYTSNDGSVKRRTDNAMKFLYDPIEADNIKILSLTTDHGKTKHLIDVESKSKATGKPTTR